LTVIKFIKAKLAKSKSILTNKSKMRKNYFTKALIVLAIITISCDDSVSDEFEEANGKVAEKLVSSAIITSIGDSSDKTTLFLEYDADKRLSSVSNGEDTDRFIYSNGDLVNVTGQGDNLSIEEFYQSPYDAFEIGQIEQYDSNLNPTKLVFFQEIYENNTARKVEYTAEITYDDAPNPYFFTLKSAGIIDVLDGIQLNFSMTPQASEIIKARKLLFKNNPSKVLYRDHNNQPLVEIDVDYVYDADNYPVSATVKAVNFDENEESFYTATFNYLQ
tara:strand:+ start:1553 stop:2377 length:825 start_codon:yes stop_codon:yes gene_type:complete